MSKMKVFSVYDKAVDAFLQPFFMRSQGEAVRSFIDAVNDGKFKHTEDYWLYMLGEFDDSVGFFIVPSEPVKLMWAKNCIPVDDPGKASVPSVS